MRRAEEWGDWFHRPRPIDTRYVDERFDDLDQALARLERAKKEDRPVSIAMFHPGWVQTDMGGPNAQISPAQSVSSMRKVIDTLDKDRSGSFFNYDGTVIPW